MNVNMQEKCQGTRQEKKQEKFKELDKCVQEKNQGTRQESIHEK